MLSNHSDHHVTERFTGCSSNRAALGAPCACACALVCRCGARLPHLTHTRGSSQVEARGRCVEAWPSDSHSSVTARTGRVEGGELKGGASRGWGSVSPELYLWRLPPQPRAPVAHLAPSRPHRPPRAEGGSVMGGCAGLAGGCAPHILNHRTVVPQRLQRVLSCLLWLSKVKLTNSEGEDFCGGVLILDNFVLTTATCSLLRTNISVKTREYVAIQLDRMAPETKTLLCRNKRKPFNLGFSLLASRW